MVRALVPLAATAAITTNTIPVLGKINRYNPSAGNLAVALPALSGLDVTANLVVEKDALDSSTNTITVSRAGSDAFDDGSTSVVLSMPGQQVHLQVVQPASTKVWKVIGGYAPLTAAGRALLDDADPAAQRTTLGATTVGGAVFTAADAAAARTTIGAAALIGRTRPRRPVTKMLGYFGATGHGFAANAVGGGGTLNANNTSYPMLGSQSLSAVYTAGNSGGQFDNTGFSAFSVAGCNVRLTFTYTGNITSFTVYLSSDTSFTNRIRRNFLSTGENIAGVEYTIDVSISDFITTGSPDLSSIVAARIVVDCGPAGGTANIGQLALTDDAAIQLPNGAVIISADDTNSDQWDYLRPQLAKYGFAATLFPTLDGFGQAGKYTLAQALYMQNIMGFEVGSHALSSAAHIDHVGLTEPQLRADFEAIVELNKQYGFRGRSYAWPNTTSDELARKVALDYFDSARGGNGNINEVWPPSLPGTERAINCGSYTLANLKLYVDRAKAGHSVAHFFMHNLPVTKVGANDMARQDMIDLIDYIAAQGVPVYTRAQLGSMGFTGVASSSKTGAGTVELGYSLDTTLSRSAPGVVAVEGVDLVDVSSAQVVAGKFFLPGRDSTVTAAATTTLTIAAKQLQIFTGTSAHTVLLPNAGVVTGRQYIISNQSSGDVTVQSSNGQTIIILTANRCATFTPKVDTPTSPSQRSFGNLTGSETTSSNTAAVRDSVGNLAARSFIPVTSSVATAGATTTLSISSAAVQIFTGASTQTVKLPTSSVSAGQVYTIINQSSGALAVQSSGGNAIGTVAAASATAPTSGRFQALVNTPTLDTHWKSV